MHGFIHLFDRLPQVGDAGDAGARPGAGSARGHVPVSSEPLIGLVRNPRSHRNTSELRDTDGVPGVLLASPTKRSELAEVLTEFAGRGVDYIAIDGGDGTVRDVLTCGAANFGESWPALIVLPSGKTNALAHDLGIPAKWTLADAVAAARRGSLVMRHPLVVTQNDDSRAQVRGFALGAGAYTQAIALGQDAHRFGAFDAAAVGVTAIWSVMQALLGASGNKWRRGTPMRLRDETGHELPHSGVGRPEERYFLFASTMRRFPAGLQPFANVEGAMRLAMLDSAHRRLLLGLPLLLRGTLGPKMRGLGAHVRAPQALELDISDRFILDGEAFPAGHYRVTTGHPLRFVVP